jgi:hypothetical protein
MGSCPISFFENGDKHFFGGARICRAFQHNQLPRTYIGRNCLGAAGDIAQIRLAIFIEWCRHADDDCVHGGNLRIVCGGGKAALTRLSYLGGGDGIDVGAAGAERVHLTLVHVKAGHREVLFTEQQCQRQSYVAHPDNADSGRVGLYRSEQGMRSCDFGRQGSTEVRVHSTFLKSLLSCNREKRQRKPLRPL